jgi:hypothetical protein
MDHSGTAVVPRKITVALSRAAGRPVPQDAHGQYRLSEHDMVFIRNRTHSAFAAHGMERFFDTIQPDDTAQQDISRHHNGGRHTRARPGRV